MREWLVIQNSWANSVFSSDDDKRPNGYIPREVAEQLLGRDLSGACYFTKCDGDRLRAHPEWRNDEPSWTPLGFWSVH